MTQQTEKTVCKTCNGERMVGGWSGGAASIDGGGSYENWPCPDCATPTYDQLSALCAQIAAALSNVEAIMSIVEPRSDKAEYLNGLTEVRAALTAYRTLSPDPQYQAGEGFKSIPDELAFYRRSYKKLTNERNYWKYIHDEKQKRLDAINRARGEG